MQLIYLLVIYCGLAMALRDQNFSKFTQNFGKKYKNEWEAKKRYAIFKKNLEIITKHNEQYENGEVSYKMGLNDYSDMSFEEVKRSLMGAKFDESNFSGAEIFKPSLSMGGLPDSVDWRKVGAVTGVKNQDPCGSCWAFATAAALESHYFIKTRQLPLLSEQNLMDCVPYSNCTIGYANYAFEYVIRNGGIDTAQSYPYKGKQGTCNFNRANIGATCRNYAILSQGDENALMEAVATVGPVVIYIEVTPSFQSYKSGIYDNPNCGKNVNHNMLVVGYGSENGHDYWLIKNSWGTNWGENGYVRMSRNKNNQCGIGLLCYFPII